MTGMRTLSFTGNGKTSMVIAMAAPTKASQGETKNVPAKNAKRNPASEPSQVFP
jgi:hypothetical protein